MVVGRGRAERGIMRTGWLMDEGENRICYLFMFSFLWSFTK